SGPARARPSHSATARHPARQQGGPPADDGSTAHRLPAAGVNARVAGSANYDEAKANPYPDLPDPLTMKNGKKVTSAKLWWDQRRPEIVEDFDREVYGRVPASVPRVKWEVTGTVNESVGDVAIVTRTVVGHVDNSAYPEITVDIQLSLSTP